LITGNLPVIFDTLKKNKFRKRYLIGGIGAFIAAVVLGAFVAETQEAAGAEEMSSILTLPVMALIGLAVGAVTLVPGMSVSTVLITMGVYGLLLFAAGNLFRGEFAYLIPFGAFIVSDITGLILSSRGIKLAFKKFPSFSNSTVFWIHRGFINRHSDTQFEAN